MTLLKRFESVLKALIQSNTVSCSNEVVDVCSTMSDNLSFVCRPSLDGLEPSGSNEEWPNNCAVSQCLCLIGFVGLWFGSLAIVCLDC